VSTEHAPTTATPAAGGRRHRGLMGLAAIVAVGGLVALLAVFQPWKLVVDDIVDEAAPAAAPADSPASAAPVASPTGAAAAASSVLARGRLISHEHATSGEVVVLRLADGRRVLRFTGLDTSNGPDLHVWLSDQPVVDGPSGWTVFDDGAYVDLGQLKGNRGSQNYALPVDVDLGRLTSVSVWCARFRVSFGAAALLPA